ncbi:RAMP superfamily CRISPR-associated protein [Tardisphaera miroshnichenkoae]
MSEYPQSEVYLFDLRFEVNHFRIGGEPDGSLLTFLRYGNDLIVPYTSWKGSFKRVSEVIARSYGGGAVTYHVNDEHKGYSDADIETILEAIGKGKIDGKKIDGSKIRLQSFPGFEGLASAFAPTEYSEDEVREIVREFVASSKCLIDRLYGSKFFASELSFSDSTLPSDVVETITHVTINRKTWTALKREETGNLFSEEVVGPLRLGVKVLLRAPSKEDMGLWKQTLEYVEEEGLQLGSGKSRGLGIARLLPAESSVKIVKGLSATSASFQQFVSQL